MLFQFGLLHYFGSMIPFGVKWSLNRQLYVINHLLVFTVLMEYFTKAL